MTEAPSSGHSDLVSTRRRGGRRARRLRTAHQVDVDAVRRIVALDDDRLRNHEITLGYWKLGRRLSALLGSECANWCTWATWASRTVGHALDPHEPPVLVVERTRRWPHIARRVAFAIARWSRSVLNPRMAGAIAEGNREVFAEIGDHFARLADRFEQQPFIDRDEARAFIAALPTAASSGTLAAERVERHRRGLLAYHDAVVEVDPMLRADHVLLGNLLMAEYEQARLQPWIEEAFFLRSNRVGTVRRRLQTMIGPFVARATTRYVAAVVTPRVLIPVAAPLAPPPGSAPYRSTGANRELEDCRHRLLDHSRLPCRSWPDYPARMASVAAMFITYHDEQSLDGEPFSSAARAELEHALASAF